MTSLPRLDIPGHSRNTSLIPTPVSPISKDTFADFPAEQKKGAGTAYSHANAPLTALDALSTVASLLNDGDYTDEQLNYAYLDIQHTHSTMAPKHRQPSPIYVDPSILMLTPPPYFHRKAINDVQSDLGIYTTTIEGVAVYISWIGDDGLCFANDPSIRTAIPVMRRVDNGMVNATLLLHAGRIETDQERSVILSLEKRKRRISLVADSMLRGFWIPLSRAVELSRTFSLDEALSVFLSEALRELFGMSSVSPAVKKRGARKSKIDLIATIDPSKLMREPIEPATRNSVSRKRLGESIQATTGGKKRFSEEAPTRGTFTNDFYQPPTFKLDSSTGDSAALVTQFTSTHYKPAHIAANDSDETEEDPTAACDADMTEDESEPITLN